MSNTPFRLMLRYQQNVSDCITEQAASIPSIFEGSFKPFIKPAHKIRGVDWSLFLQFIVPTLVAEQIEFQEHESRRQGRSKPDEEVKAVLDALY
ncbi:hypothetical protein A0J61_11629, partial [Choanephora cucurbitarum]